MSVVSVSIISLVPGGLVISGLIVAGIMIGKAIENAADKNQKENEKIAGETLEANKKDLLTGFNDSVQMVISEIIEFEDDFKEQIANEINMLKSLPEKAIANYNLEIYKSDYHEQFVNQMIEGFNNKVLEIKQKLEEVKIEIAEAKILFETKEKQLESLSQSLEVPHELKNDYKSLKEQFAEIKSIKSNRDKNNLILPFEKKLNEFADTCNISNQINLGTLREEKLNIPEAESANKLLQKEIFNFHEKIKFLDTEAFIELEELVQESAEENYRQRLELIRDQVKLKYGKVRENVAQTNVYKQSLAKLNILLPKFAGSEELVRQITSLLQIKYISKGNFEEISRRVNDFIAHAQTAEIMKLRKKELAGKVKTSLEKIGYSVIDDTKDENEIITKLDNGEIVYLDTEWADYKVMLKIDESSQIATRLVKFVATEAEKANISTYQSQKDGEVARKWCKHYDQFLAEMKKNGVEIEVKLRKEPDEEDITYIVNKDLVSGKKSEINKINSNNQMGL